MILVIFLYATAVCLPSLSSALIVYFTLFSYLYFFVDEAPNISTASNRAFRFLRGKYR